MYTRRLKKDTGYFDVFAFYYTDKVDGSIHTGRCDQRVFGELVGANNAEIFKID